MVVSRLLNSERVRARSGTEAERLGVPVGSEFEDDEPVIITFRLGNVRDFLKLLEELDTTDGMKNIVC